MRDDVVRVARNREPGVTVGSMSRVGAAGDNAAVKSFFALPQTLKQF